MPSFLIREGGTKEETTQEKMKSSRSKSDVVEYARQNLVEGEEWHRRTNVREIVFGFNDAAISILALIAGVIGGSLTRGQTTVAALSGIIGGAISMAIGAYISTKSEIEHHRSEIMRESREIREWPDIEREELRQIYMKKAPFTEEEMEIILDRLTGDDQVFLDTMMKEELGLFEERFESPVKVALVMFVAFIFGGLFPIVPFLLFSAPFTGLVASSLVTFGALFFIGVWKTTFTERHWLPSGLEMVGVGVVAAVVPYLLGDIFLQRLLTVFVGS